MLPCFAWEHIIYKGNDKMDKTQLISLNVSKFIKEQRSFFILLVISQIAACLAIFFAMGAIHNTRNEQKDIDVRTMYFEADSVNVFLDENCEADYSNCETMNDFQKKAERVIATIPKDILSYVKIGGITSAENPIKYSAVYIVPETFMLTQKDIENGEYVAAISKYGAFSEKTTNDKITVNDKEYTVVSVGDYVGDMIIPLKAASPDFIAYNFRIEFNSVPSNELAGEISNVMEELFPSSEISVPEIPDLMTIQFNRTMIIASAVVIAVVVLNLGYCYCYLFMRRKKTIAIYMICGCSNSSAVNLMVTESAVISFVCYMISFCIMKPLAPLLTNVYAAAEYLYSLKFFVIVGIVYIIITIAVLKIMFSSIINKSAVDLKRGV